MKINQYLDATYLKTASQAQISEEENLQKIQLLLEESLKFHYKLIMIRHNYIPFAKQFLTKKKGDALVGTVIGFHEGTYSLESKLNEAKIAIELGADELDFVINFEAFKIGNIDLVKQEVFEGTKLCLEHKKTVKWIIEVAALTSKQIGEISTLIKETVLQNFGIESSPKVFVKSSTGFFKTENNLPNGATFETIKLMIKHGKPLQIKAAGGVRDYETAIKMIDLGVDRIGTSSSKEICMEAPSF